MKKVQFWITDVLNEQIREAILRFGTKDKSEFFRMLAYNYIKENKITPKPQGEELKMPKLSPEEAMKKNHIGN